MENSIENMHTDVRVKRVDIPNNIQKFVGEKMTRYLSLHPDRNIDSRSSSSDHYLQTNKNRKKNSTSATVAY